MPRLDHKTSNFRRDALANLRQLAAKLRASEPWRAQCLERLIYAIDRLTDRRVPSQLEIELPDGEAQLLGHLDDDPPRARMLRVTPPDRLPAAGQSPDDLDDSAP